MSTPRAARDTTPLPLPSSLAEQHVLILGGSRGIGAAAARLLVSTNAHVSLVARSEDQLEVFADQLKAAYPAARRPTTLAVDVTDTDALRRAVDGLEPIDHVFATAAQSGQGPLASTPLRDVRRAMDRVFVAYELAQLVAERLPPGGSLTLVSGALAVKPIVGLAMVAASVGAIESMARVLALELAPIRVNVLRPGYTATREVLGGEDAIDELGQSVPAGRVGSPEEVAAGALGCMSNPYMTGSVVQVDGGLLLG